MIWLLAVCIIMAIGAVIFYKYYAPKLMADAITKEDLPSFLPSKVQQKIKKYKEPINAAAEDVVIQMREKEIGIDQMTSAIEEIREDDVNAITNDLKALQPKTSDETFDIIKNNLRTDFDMEILREPFNKHVNDKMIARALKNLNESPDSEIDLTMFKNVAKTILIQKAEQLRGETKEAK